MVDGEPIMTTTSFHDLSADLDGLLDALDRRLSAPVGTSGPRPGHQTAPVGPTSRSGTGHLERQLAASVASCFRLIDVVRSARGVAGPVPAALPVPVPQVAPAPQPHRPAVSPLSVPDRILKREYNYFDRLNADLAELAEKHRMASDGTAAISTY
jgi:hypothetical protein